MTRHKEIPQRDRSAVEARLRAADTPVRATRIGRAIAAKIPQTWDGQGDPPIGWTRYWGMQEDPETGDALFSADTGFVAKVPELSGATRERPERWRTALGASQDDSDAKARQEAHAVGEPNGA